MSRVPLAWKNLTNSVPRLLLSLAGVGFAVVLMFMQTGFRNALFDSTVKPIDEMDGELIVISKARNSLSRSSRFPLHELQSLQGIEGITAVRPIYIEMMAAILRVEQNRGRPIRVIGVRGSDCPLRNDAIQRQLPLIQGPQTALMDRRTKSVFGLRSELASANIPQDAELAERAITIVGGFDLGTDFANEGNLVMTAENFANYFPLRGSRRPLSVVDVGVLSVAPDTQLSTALARVRQALPPHLQVLTRSSFRDREIRFWATKTPIGIIFGIGTVMGFVVGIIICYQVIYTDINDLMAELATLKAMGYPSSYFVRLVLAQSVYLSVLGFLPGLMISWGLFEVVAANTGLLMYLTVGRAMFVLGLTLIMCVISGSIALRRLVSADPASLF